MTLAVSRGLTPRATASVMMFVRSPRAVSLMTFQSLNVVSRLTLSGSDNPGCLKLL